MHKFLINKKIVFTEKGYRVKLNSIKKYLLKSICRSRIQKQPPELFLKILQNSQENTCFWSLIFTKLQSLQASNGNKMRLQHRCFPVKFEKFLRTPILKNIWTAASVYWLLHHILIFTILYSTTFSFSQITSSLLHN